MKRHMEPKPAPASAHTHHHHPHGPGSSRREWLRRTAVPWGAVVHVLFVVSNPIHFRRRFDLARDTFARFRRDEEAPKHPVKTYVVELAYGEDPFGVTSAEDPTHLQVRADPAGILWHKENMINLGVRHLLPPDWAVMAWVDADIEFENDTWSEEALRVLLGSGEPGAPALYDVVQLFSHADDMDAAGHTLSLFPSFGFQHAKGKTHRANIPAANLWHPGFAWAVSRAAYDQMGGLFDLSILGSGDFNMAMSLIGRGEHSLDARTSPGYKRAVVEFQRRAKGLRLGYVSGVVRHHFHGQKANRKYQERWKYLVDHQYDPHTHVALNDFGLLVPTAACPPGLLEDILKYFRERNEDECFYPFPGTTPPLPPSPSPDPAPAAAQVSATTSPGAPSHSPPADDCVEGVFP